MNPRLPDRPAPEPEGLVEQAWRAANLLAASAQSGARALAERMVDLLAEPAGAFQLPDGRLIAVNAAASREVDLDPAFARGARATELAEFLHPADRPRLLALVDLLVRDRDTRGVTLACRFRIGGQPWRTFQVALAVAGEGDDCVLAWVARPAERGAAAWIEEARRASEEGHWRLDLDGGGLDTDEAWRCACGGPPSLPPPLTAAEWIARVHPADRPRFEALLAGVRQGLSTHLECELRMTTRDETTRWVRVRGERTADGRHLAGTVRDIDAQRRRIDRLAADAAWFRALVDGAPDGIVVHEAGRVVYANRRFAEMVGVAHRAHLLGEPLLRWVHPADRAEVARVSRAGAAGETVEVRLSREDGRTVAAELSGVPLPRAAEGCALLVVRDVERRKALEAKLAQTDRMATLGMVAAGVAHEINNPLSYVVLSLDELAEEIPRVAKLVEEAARCGGAEEGEFGRLVEMAREMLSAGLTEQLLESVRDASDGTRRVQRIVEELHVFSHVEEQPGPGDLNRAASTAANLARHRIKHRAELRVELGDVAPVAADEGRLSQVLLNLLVNAADAMEEASSDERVITLRTGMRDGQVFAAVRDTGPGIPPDVGERIFDPFFTTKPPGTGSGLGLAICQHIVRSAGGRIEYDSEVGRGTEFRVLLPPLARLESEAPVDEDSTSSVPPDAPRRPRVLLVDDEERFATRLARRLEREFEVVARTCGADAIELLEAGEDFDIILSDLMMADVSGAELYRWVEEHRPELLDRIVFITGGAAGRADRRFLESVDNVVVEKPVDARNLARLLRHLVHPAPGTEAAPAPRRRERRSGPRFPAGHIEAVVTVGGERYTMRLVDYSNSGIRCHGLPGDVEVARLQRARAVLRSQRHPGQVVGEVALARFALSPTGRDPCFRFFPIDAEARRTYERWLASEQ